MLAGALNHYGSGESAVVAHDDVTIACPAGSSRPWSAVSATPSTRPQDAHLDRHGGPARVEADREPGRVLADHGRQPFVHAQRNAGGHRAMKSIENGPTKLLMGRRNFLARTAALGAGVGLSATALASCADDQKDPDISPGAQDVSLRDQDLKFIGTEETF